MSLGRLQSLWRAALPPQARVLAAPLLRHGLRAYVHASRRPAPVAGPLPIRVVGFFGQSHGIAASAKLAVRAFEALGAAVETVAIGPGLDARAALQDPSPALWIFHLNPPELVGALASLGPTRVAGPRFGYWAWELPKAPADWLADARLLDEVWAPSQYVAQALDGARAPVRAVPHPLFPEDYRGVAPAPRTAAFQAVTLFDFNSSAARKNPEGTIAAFRRAFGDDPACELVIKTQNGAQHPQALARLRASAGPQVRVVNESWPYAEVKRLIAGADVLISLHRAEGFGLTMAEAMALGTPTIATAATGNLDFQDEASALLVPFTPTPVEDPQRIYRGQTWAEPDVEAAAHALRRLRDEPGLGARLAEAGRVRVAERLSPDAWLRSLPEAVQAAVAHQRSGLFGV
ncbi:glycosyltransferase family 4 protein [Phenylobacterium sp.]|uniref:glycosyltransferase family 4 protein n=1 Tax=Phenylobacterium sp. TaxID=1871053 RepID=UPI0028125D45|nr:glycosyltransferase family 4 protein [Phenylobacterium sp.]